MKMETERLVIRSIQKGDEKALADMAKDGSLCSTGIVSWIHPRSLSLKGNISL